MTMAERGDLAVLTTTTNPSYLRSSEPRARLYEVSSVSRDGQVKAVRTSASAPIKRIQDMGVLDLNVYSGKEFDVASALLAAPFEGFDSSQEAAQYVSHYRRAS